MPQTSYDGYIRPSLKLPIRVALLVSGLDFSTFLTLLPLDPESVAKPCLPFAAHTWMSDRGRYSYSYCYNSYPVLTSAALFTAILKTIPLNATPLQQAELLGQRGFVWANELYTACLVHHQDLDSRLIGLKCLEPYAYEQRKRLSDHWNDPLLDTVLLMQRHAYQSALGTGGYPPRTETSKSRSESPREKIPLRFAYPITGLSFNDFWSLIVSPRIGREFGSSEDDYYVTPYFYDAIPTLKPLSHWDLCNKIPLSNPIDTFSLLGLYSIIPVNAMVWSDELYVGFSEYMCDANRAYEIERLWNEPLLESVKLIEESLDWCEEAGFEPIYTPPPWIRSDSIETTTSQSQLTRESPEEMSDFDHEAENEALWNENILKLQGLVEESEDRVGPDWFEPLDLSPPLICIDSIQATTSQSQLTGKSPEEGRQDGEELIHGVVWKDNVPIRLLKPEGFEALHKKPETDARDDHIYLGFLYIKHNKRGKSNNWYHLALAGPKRGPDVKMPGSQIGVNQKYHYRKLHSSTIAKITRRYDEFFGEKSLPNPPSEKPL